MGGSLDSMGTNKSHRSKLNFFFFFFFLIWCYGIFQSDGIDVMQFDTERASLIRFESRVIPCFG